MKWYILLLIPWLMDPLIFLWLYRFFRLWTGPNKRMLGILSSPFTLVFSCIRSNPEFLVCEFLSRSSLSISLQQFNHIINIVLGVGLIMALIVASIFWKHTIGLGSRVRLSPHGSHNFQAARKVTRILKWGFPDHPLWGFVASSQDDFSDSRRRGTISYVVLLCM
jgi:hypothetical protein